MSDTPRDLESFEEETVPPRTGPPRFEAFVLLYTTVGLSFVWMNGSIRSLPQPWPLFTWFGINFVVLFCIPALIVRYGWRMSLAHLGLRRGDVPTWGRYFVVFLVVMIPLVLIISRTPDFQHYYPRCGPARSSAGWFLFSAVGWLVYFFAWEWFFRGFMLLSLAPRYGGGIAILMQTIPFVMMHYGKPPAEAWSAIIAGLALGLMAFRSGSFIGPWLLHWAVQMTMDLSVILWPAR